MPYEVQMSTGFADIWHNALTATKREERSGECKLRTFATRMEAQAALHELLTGIADDIAAGLSPPWTEDHFRIAYVAPVTRQQQRPFYLDVLEEMFEDIVRSPW